VKSIPQELYLYSRITEVINDQHEKQSTDMLKINKNNGYRDHK